MNTFHSVPSTLHILIVFTGGTISSNTTSTNITLKAEPKFLLDLIPPNEFTYETITPYQILSENLTFSHFQILFSQIYLATSTQNYDGILLLHGTDTASYTAQMTNLLCGFLTSNPKKPCPFIIFGSKITLDYPEADGFINFKNALFLLKQIHFSKQKSLIFLSDSTVFTYTLPSTTYVIGRNKLGVDYVHLASHVITPYAESDDIQSHLNEFWGTIKDNNFHLNPEHSFVKQSLKQAIAGQNFATKNTDSPSFMQEVQMVPLSFFFPHTLPFSNRNLLEEYYNLTVKARNKNDSTAKLSLYKTVLLLQPFVGLNYQSIRLDSPNFDFIIHGLYHSATACSNPLNSSNEDVFSLFYFIKAAAKHNKTVFIGPLKSDRKLYQTTVELLKYNIVTFADVPMENVWARLLLASWLEEDYLNFWF